MISVAIQRIPIAVSYEPRATSYDLHCCFLTLIFLILYLLSWMFSGDI